jgi:hypothetical protein
MLAGWFTTRASRADRLRFWRAYFEARGLGRWQRGACRPQEPLGLARELESRARARALNFWRGRDRRCLVSNRYYRRLRAPGVRGYAVTDLDRDTLTSLVADPDAAFGAAGVRLLKDSRSSTVAELEIFHEGAPRRVIYKRFAVTAWSDPVAALVRPTAALRSWKFGHGLRERCLPTARPLLVLHACVRGWRARAISCAKKSKTLWICTLFWQAWRSVLSAPGRGCCARLSMRWPGWCAACTAAACRIAISRPATC